MEQFKLGDLVCLKSDPDVDMTVKEIDGDYVITIYHSKRCF